MNKAWTFVIDNAIPIQLLNAGIIRREEVFPQGPLPEPVQLCEDCQGLDFHRLHLGISRMISELKDPSRNCTLCRMIWSACLKHSAVLEGSSEVWLEEYQSTLRLNDVSHPVLSIVYGPGNDPPPPNPREPLTQARQS